jgi:hypothetical protein
MILPGQSPTRCKHRQVVLCGRLVIWKTWQGRSCLDPVVAQKFGNWSGDPCVFMGAAIVIVWMLWWSILEMVMTFISLLSGPMTIWDTLFFNREANKVDDGM